MDLYTFILEYSGGTYISQVRALSQLDAMREWLKNLNTSDLDGFMENEKQKLIEEDFINEEPILIQGCLNVWCFGIRINKVFCLVNFIKTEPTAHSMTKTK